MPDVDEERLIFDSLISPILYLFKDSSYSYEREYRIMYSFDHYTSRIHHTGQTPPRLYVLPENAIQIDELILGPKFNNVTNLMPYLREQLEKMADVTKTRVPRVTISNIEFR